MRILIATLAALGAFLSTSAHAEEPQSIASAGGDITEILFEFGVGDRVVAVDTTSIFPPEVNDLPKIGYVRDLSAEGVLSTGADVLIGSDDIGSPATITNLRAAGMRVESAPKGSGAERFPEKVRFVGDVLNLPERADEMIADYKTQLEEIVTRRDALPRNPRALLILSVRDGAILAAGRGTTGHDILTVSGAENVADFDSWKPMNAEAVIAAAPEIIVMSGIHTQRLGGVETVMERADIAATPAGANNSYIILNAQMMLQFGPRSTEAMADLLTAFEALASSP